MAIDNWQAIRDTTGLPADTRLLVQQTEYVVLASDLARTVYRIGVNGQSSFGLNPSNIASSHILGAKMAEAGLNVLSPHGPRPRVAGPFIISESPLATPLTDYLWTAAEALLLGQELAGWAEFSDPDLEDLDVSAYARERALGAASGRGGLARAGQWCLDFLDRLEHRYPFGELVQSSPGTIHGDIHTGNLVRHHHPALLLIDLDSVKRGPAMYDIAVALLYQRRFNPRYPGKLILNGYGQARAVGPVQEDELTGLQWWKEASSYSQLLLRWGQGPDIAHEFWNRTSLGWHGKWVNVVHTPTHSVRADHS